jgi:hypothetical protein
MICVDEGRSPLQGRGDEAEKARWRAWVGGADRTRYENASSVGVGLALTQEQQPGSIVTARQARVIEPGSSDGSPSALCNTR